jgi:(p)ppGpp synthase/HD superfamily hydrolase
VSEPAPTLAGPELVETAERVARDAHRDQVDKAGHPYADHPARVAARVADDPVAASVAWLHDTVEDTGTTLEGLRVLGFPAVVREAVDAMTRRGDEDPDAYYERVAGNETAVRVKRADIADNSDPQRLARLDEALRERLEEKYAHATRRLDELARASSDES